MLCFLLFVCVRVMWRGRVRVLFSSFCVRVCDEGEGKRSIEREGR